MKKLLFSLLAFTGLALLIDEPAKGEVININLGYLPQHSNAYVEEGNIWWNKFATWGTVSPAYLYDSENNRTDIRWETRQKFTGHSASELSSSIYGYPESVFQSNFYVSGNDVAQVIISGLDISKTYEFTFYGNVRAVAAKRGMDITMTGEGDSSMQTLSLAGTSIKSDESEVVFSNIKPNSDGIVTIDFMVTPGFDRGVVNAITIYSIPEASSVALAFTGGVGFLLIRKFY